MPSSTVKVWESSHSIVHNDYMIQEDAGKYEYTLISSPTGSRALVSTITALEYSLYYMLVTVLVTVTTGYQVEEVQKTNGALSFSSTSSPGTHSNAQRDALYTELPMLLLPSSTTM
jgi:hypothetical protein